MRARKTSRALLASAATVSILGTTGIASHAAVAADHGSAALKRTCKVSAYTDRVDRRTDKFGNGAIQCNYKPALHEDRRHPLQGQEEDGDGQVRQPQEVLFCRHQGNQGRQARPEVAHQGHRSLGLRKAQDRVEQAAARLSRTRTARSPASDR